MENFEKLMVWQEGMNIARTVYALLKECTDFGLRNQMQRASVSIPSNIAEGSERGSDKEFIRFLRIAKGSAGELRTQLILAVDVQIVEKEKAENIIKDCIKVSKMIQKLIEVRSKNI